MVGKELLQKSRKGEKARASTRRIRRRRGWRSPITRRILAINVVALVIPILGLLHLEDYRETLIASEVEALRIQARAFALSFANNAVESFDTGEDILRAQEAQRLMRVLFEDTGVRARIFDRGGNLVADSFRLTGSGAQVVVVELPPITESFWQRFGRLYDGLALWLPGSGSMPLYSEARDQEASHYWEAEGALEGDSPSAVRRLQEGGLHLSVAVPVQRYRQVLAALMLSKGGEEIRHAVEDRRRDILAIFGLAIAITILLSLYLARAIARPLHRLALAAQGVQQGLDRDSSTIPDLRDRGDEIGDLSGALREMTEALHDRLDAIEGFAADVAHEIKNPLTSLRSAVETVARVQDPEQQRRLMSIILDDVSRLDRLISDISDASRLDAELNRAEMEEIDLNALMETMRELHEVGRMGEDQDTSPRIELRLATEGPLIVRGLEGRLGQVLRNLISNAVTFSPADGVIWMLVEPGLSGPRIVIEDAGPGLPEDKLEAIFDRFYSERPKDEKFGTHSGLGLSISKQIIDAHGGQIYAQNRKDESGHVIGARFVIELPDRGDQ